jgi:hypothetical protein
MSLFFMLILMLLLLLPCSPDLTNPDDISSWLTHLPVYRGVMGTYMQTVNSVADSAVAGYQQRIQEVQQHRDRLQAEADAYIRGLLAQGKQVLQRVEACTAKPKQQQAQQQTQRQQQQQPQQPEPAVKPAGAAAGDLQSAVQALLSNRGHRTKKHVQAKQAVLQQQAVSKVQQQQQQQEQPVGVKEAADTLPFPGGPASKWLVSKVRRLCCVAKGSCPAQSKCHLANSNSPIEPAACPIDTCKSHLICVPLT